MMELSIITIIVIIFHILVGVPTCEIHDVPELRLRVQCFTDVPLVSGGIIMALTVGVVAPYVLGVVSANRLSQEEASLDVFLP